MERTHGLPCAPLLAAALAALATAACGSPGATAPPAADAGSDAKVIPPPSACNGHAELCDRRFNEVVYPATHNAMSSFDEGWAAANQQHGMTRQLEDGIRAMLIDTHYWNDDTYLCHSICQLGSELLVDGLTKIRVFMDEHPHEVLTLIIQDGISPADTEAAFVKSGLIGHVFVHEPGSEWPTLRAMIERGQRLVVTAEEAGPPPAWYHHVWDLTWDTPYSFASQDDFSCAENRGKRGNDLFLLNHWIEDPLPTEQLATVANEHAVLSARAQQCTLEGGQKPNFVAVNFYSIGALFQVVDELNGL